MPRNRLTTITYPLGHTTVYGYDRSGNQQTVTDGLGHTTTTLYDADDRATTISALGGITTIYPARPSPPMTDEACTTFGTPTYSALATYVYNYDSANRVTSEKDAEGTFTYDNAANLISDNNGTTITTYTYDYRNRLTEVTQGRTISATYTYNALNQRIGIKDNGTRTWTVYDGEKERMTNGNGRRRGQ